VSTAQALPITDRRWTADDLDELVELLDDRYRYECLDGQLIQMAPAMPLHQRVSKRLLLQLHSQLPAGWDVLFECGVRLDSDWRIPDLLVIPDQLSGRRLFDPAEVQLVVEVASDSSRRTDRIVKPAEYADAGIGYCWRIEPEPELVLAAYTLEGRRYGEPQIFDAGTVTPPAPFRLAVDLDALVGPPRQ